LAKVLEYLARPMLTLSLYNSEDHVQRQMTGTNVGAPIPVGVSFLVRRTRDDGTLGKEKERPKPPLRSHIISLLLDATAFAEGD
jgi:hypothetical protein